ncbi:MAG: hypothetical protein JWO05_776 [Gemmatimonadetes bacterium]|nr:hypothetical protein [Gemmatimonadota bacterium]
MVAHEAEFRQHLAGLASTDRYVRFLRDISDAARRPITPQSLRTEADIESFTESLSQKYSEKSIANYRSVMRRYVDMVGKRRL